MSGIFSKAHISPGEVRLIPKSPIYPEFDPAKAQKLLADRRPSPRGKVCPRLTYYTSVGLYPKTKEYAELITGMLQVAGFQG